MTIEADELAAPPTSIKNREVFSVGKWAGSATVDATKEYLAEMVKSYNELNSKVSGFAIPLKLGHNKRIGEPAFGYAQNVHLSDDGTTLLADFEDVPPEIVDAIQKKKYNAASVEIWPKIEYAGQTFLNVLGAVALLGAEWPAVKGLMPLSMFSDQAAPIQLLKEDESVKTFTEVEFDAAVVAMTERADRAEAALAAFQETAEKKEVADVIEAAEKAGKIVPANKAAIVAMAEAIRMSVDPAKRTEAMKTFKTFIEAMPDKVKFGENGGSNQENAGNGTASERLDAAAKREMAAKKLNYREAIDLVLATDPALKEAYAEENR